jgi:predicted ATPase
VELDARMTRLRAATRLARLHREAGEADAAAAVVGPAYASFSEGFDTADLREARDLLDGVGWPA